MSAFPVTSATLIQKIKNLPPGKDGAAWVRFWDSYSAAIRVFAARKGGDANADDIVMSVFGKLVEVLRSGQYSPDKGAFHSYLSTMILNEVYMLHRKEIARKVDKRISLDTPVIKDEVGENGEKTLSDVLPADTPTPDQIDEEWRKAILESAKDHVFNKTALSQRDRDVYREYAMDGRPIEEVAAKYNISRNSVSQIKTRINRRIVAVGQELVSGFGKV